ncbi:MAG: HD-GYP domain-containing protein [Guyparkeria sp.]
MTGPPANTASRDNREDAQDHYLDHVVEASDRVGLATSEALTDQNGMVLAGAGTPMTAELRDRLVRHKLLRPIDESLSVQDPVTTERLLERADALLGSNPLLQRLAEQLPDSGRLRSMIRTIDLPRPLQIKLTVAAANEPTRLDHALMVTLTALAIGLRHDLPVGELKSLALAGVLHDLGELHIDPSIYRSSADLSVPMRRQIEAHPVIMHAVLESLDSRYVDAARAILEHHERVDGSGYPRGLAGRRLSLLGQVLGLAEFLASLHARRESTHMIVALKLQRHHFDSDLVETTFRLLGPASISTGVAPHTFHDLVDRLSNLMDVVIAWKGLAARGDQVGLPATHQAWLQERAATIRHHFSRLGMHAEGLERSLEPIAQDDEAIAELSIIAEEIRRQIMDTSWEAHRRIGPALIEGLPEAERQVLTRPLDNQTPTAGRQ